MKKQVFIFVILLTLSFSAFSQLKIGIMAGGGFATDSIYASKVNKIGGAAVMVKYVFADRFSLGVNVGLNGLDTRPNTDIPTLTYDNNGVAVFVNADYYTKTKSYILSSFGLSFEYYFSKKGVKPYAGLDVSYYRFNYSNTLIGLQPINVAYGGVGLSPTLGFLIETMPNLELGFNIKYNVIFDYFRQQTFGDHFTKRTDIPDQPGVQEPPVVKVTGNYSGVSSYTPMQYVSFNITIMYKFGKSSLSTEVAQ